MTLAFSLLHSYAPIDLWLLDTDAELDSTEYLRQLAQTINDVIRGSDGTTRDRVHVSTRNQRQVMDQFAGLTQDYG